MDIREFAALKEGDKIQSLMQGPGIGTVAEVLERGVRLYWGPKTGHETLFYYDVNSTAWKHWDKVEPCGFAPQAGAEDGV